MLDWPFPFWIAHRGAGRAVPENTLAAFRHGAAQGFRAFECDVQLSRDGVPFLLHDATLARTTNGHGLGCETNWATLAGLDAGSWHSPTHAGEPLLTLATLAEWAARHRWHVNLELKPSPGEATRLGAAIAVWLRQHWRAPPPMLSSFEPAALQAVGLAYPKGLLIEQWEDDTLSQAQALQVVAVVGHHEVWTLSTVAATHAAGLAALAYTVNDPTTARRLVNAGLDGLITDNMALPKVVV